MATMLNVLIKWNCDRSAVTCNVEWKKSCWQPCRKKKAAPKTKSRAEKNSRARKKKVVSKKSRANGTVVPKKRVVPEKTNIVKKKLDEKN